MNRIELLAPARNLETGIAAINSGADAIYIGASDFGARANASNNMGSIEKLVNYAHKFYVRVHVTINTILNDEELKQAIDLIHKLYKIGVDAIIIQDFGLLQASVQGLLPPIEIHMSTQCNNRSLEKVKFFDEIGASRVILARELPLSQISDICKNVNCEIETFIYGALCVCYSGQCYFSYANGGRSANRGKCAQPCRKKYSLVTDDGEVLLKNKYLLSMKDFNASEHIKSLIDCGVKSFKIEGRLKDINYVKNVTAYYDKIFNKYAQRTSSGQVFLDFEPNVYKTFNRGFTDYFLKKRSECYNFISPKSLGEKVGKILNISENYLVTNAKLNPQDGICFGHNGELSGFLVNRVDGNKIYPNNMPDIKKGTIIYRNYDSQFDKVLSNSKTVRKIGIKIKVENDFIKAIDEDCNQASIKIPNSKISNDPENMRNTYVKQLSKLGDSDFYLLDIVINQEAISFLPISQINELRRILLQKLMNERIRNYRQNRQKHICYADFPHKNVDYRANITNKKAEEFYKNCNCKVCELALETSTDIKSGVELMRTKHCLRFACNICSQNSKFNKNLFLVDENGKKYPLIFDCINCEMAILNP